MSRSRQEGAPGVPAAEILGVLRKVVRARRRARGWSLRHLAQIATVSYSSLCNFETGHAAMDLVLFFRVAAALDLPVLPGLLPPAGNPRHAALLQEVLLLLVQVPPPSVAAVHTLLTHGLGGRRRGKQHTLRDNGTSSRSASCPVSAL